MWRVPGSNPGQPDRPGQWHSPPPPWLQTWAWLRVESWVDSIKRFLLESWGNLNQYLGIRLNWVDFELTLARAGEGSMRPLPWVFWNGFRTAGRISAEISHGLWCILCTTFGNVFLTKSGQVTELWRHKWYSLRPIFSKKSCFHPRNLLPLTRMEILCMIYVSTRSHLTFDIPAWPFKGHPRSLNVTDPMHTYSG